MAADQADFTEAVFSHAQTQADACVNCGACHAVCPMLEPAGLPTGDPAAHAAIAGVLDLVRGGEGSADAVRWADACTSSGRCIPACEHGVNPRLLLRVAGMAAKNRTKDRATVRAAAAGNFAAMARNVNALAPMLLSEADQARLRPGRETPEETPDVVFYTGCNVLKTPHIALLCLDILDALGVRHVVRGGTGTCCGIQQSRAGDTAMAGRVIRSTLRTLSEPGAAEVLAWCPTCHVQFAEFALPALAAAGEAEPFAMTPFLMFLERHLDALRPLLTRAVPCRVALHERPGLPDVMRAARALLSAVPGVELVELDVPRYGLMANYMAVLPAHKAATVQRELAAAAEADVTTLATIYHACHRDLCHFEDGRPFEIVNFLEIVGQSMGIVREDLYKRLKLLGDADAIVADQADVIAARGLDAGRVRAALVADMMLAP